MMITWQIFLKKGDKKIKRAKQKVETRPPQKFLKLNEMSPLNSSELLKLQFWENPQMSLVKGSQHPPKPSIFFACFLPLFTLPEFFSYRSCRRNKSCNFNFLQVFLGLYVNWSQPSFCTSIGDAFFFETTQQIFLISCIKAYNHKY